MQQKTGLNKVTQLSGFGYNINVGTGTTTTYERGGKLSRHPYMRQEFWRNPSNHFWNTDLYSKESKEYFNDFITRQ